MATSGTKIAEKPQAVDDDRQPGVVYIGHVPHGFYERQLRKYFTQFGAVQAVKVSRSNKTGNSKGYAFIKFKYGAVAKTVAETCHNYLFFNKILKCEYKSMSEVHEDTFHTYKWKPNYKNKRQHNSVKEQEKLDESLQKSARRKQGKLDKLNLKLEDVMNVPEVATRKRTITKVVSEPESPDTENVSTNSETEKVSVKKQARRRSARKTRTPPARKTKTPPAQSKSGVGTRKTKTPPAQSKSGVVKRKPKPPPAKKARSS